MDYQTKIEPWAHQAEGLRRLKGRAAYALLMDMRTGKTKVTLDDFGRLEAEGKATDLMVIAPAGVYQTWEKAIAEHVGEELASRLMTFRYSSSSNGKEYRERLKQFMDNPKRRPRILLVNVEALSNVQRARDLCIKFLSAGRSVLVVDESTAIKNHQALRAKFVVNSLAPLARYRRILTGLPTPQGPLDLFMQFHFLDPTILGHRSFVTFRARYAITQLKQFNHTRRPVWVVVGYRNTEELQGLIADHSYRVRLDECYDLPEKMYQPRYVTMTDKQAELYREIKTHACAKIESELASGHVSATLVITQMLRLHQVLCGHVVDEAGVEHIVPEKRTDELINLLSEFDGKAIIWVSYDADVRKVSAAIEKEFRANAEEDRSPIDEKRLTRVARFWGGNVTTREAEERKFLSDPECRFMVATPAAGGRGRTWNVASLVVYYSSTNNLEHRSQSEERAQAVGKKDSVLYVDLIVPGTVEEQIIGALRDKIDLAGAITGDDYRRWLI